MSRRSAPFLLACLVPVSAAFVACGSDSSTFDPPSSSSSGDNGTSSGTFDPGPQRDGGSSGKPIEPGCGNAFLEEGEVCDDANRVAGDGCSADCKTVEAGYQCLSEGAACVAICGDGVLLGDEDCDDGNTRVDDGCSAGCRLEPGFQCLTPGAACVRTVCGNGVREGTEQCDDTQTGEVDRPFDGCYNCVKEPSCATGAGCTGVCGDGLIFPNEACDDGNTRDGDGCSSTCTPETGFECSIQTELPPGTLELPVIYRDFHSVHAAGGHPDFEAFQGFGAYLDLVAPALGATGTPVFAGTSATPSPCVVKKKRIVSGACVARLVSSFPPGVTTADQLVATSCNNRPQLSGGAGFGDWYRDAPGVNSTVVGTLPLGGAGNGVYAYDSAVSTTDGFFPLDGKGFGVDLGTVCRNQEGTPVECRVCRSDDGAGPQRACIDTDTTDTSGRLHNFHFTTEVRYWFTYRAAATDAEAPVLNFTGDDDVWIFINGKRVIDLGGLHSRMGHDPNQCYDDTDPGGERLAARVDNGTYVLTAANAAALGLTDQNVYEIALFHAERKADASNFKFTLGGFEKKRTTCEPKCGDGVKTKNETCDDGILAGGYNQCGPNCTWGPRCGDGITQPEFGEACDDGNFVLNDGCLPTCQLGDTIN